MRMRLEGSMGSKAKFSQRIDVPGTADTPENLQGGVLLVFPPGFGPTLSPGLDASAQALERQKLSRPRGRITARQVDRGPEVPQLLKWLERAGFPVAQEAARFSIFTWPQRWEADRPLDRRVLKAAAADAARLAEEVKKRRPLLLFFVSAQLLDAANLPEVLEALEPVLVHPAEPVRRITDLRLRVTAQRWVKALCFGLPMPRKTFTPETEETIAAGIAAIFRREELLPS